MQSCKGFIRSSQSVPLSFAPKKCPHYTQHLHIPHQLWRPIYDLQRAKHLSPTAGTRYQKWRAPSNLDIVTDDLEATIQRHRERLEIARKAVEGVDRAVQSAPPSSQFLPYNSPIEEPESLVETTRLETVQTAKHVEKAQGLPQKQSGIINSQNQGHHNGTTSAQLLNIKYDSELRKPDPVDKFYDSKPGKSQEPRGRWSLNSFVSQEARQLYACPWLGDDSPQNITDMARLQWEIEAFVKLVSLSENQTSAIKMVRNQVEAVIRETLPHYKTIIHGSHATGVATPISDLDICIFSSEFDKASKERGPSPSHPRLRRAAHHALKSLQSALKSHKSFKNIAMIRAKVTVLTATHCDSNLSVQIISDNPVIPAIEYSRYYLAEFAELLPIYQILKFALTIRQMDSPYEGGLGSYTLLIMVLTAIKHSPPIPSENQLAHRLLQVLNFWAEADTTSVGYAADPPRTFPKFHRKLVLDEEYDIPGDEAYRQGIETIAETNARRRQNHRNGKDKVNYLLCLQDPANPTNDLGRRTYMMKDVQATFSYCQRQIIENLQKWSKTVSSQEKMNVGLLYPIVGGNYLSMLEHSTRLRNTGARANGTKVVNNEVSKVLAKRIRIY